MAVRMKRHRFAIDQDAPDRQAAYRLRDIRKPVGELRAMAAPYVDAVALLSSENAKSVVLHLVPLARPGGRIGD